MALFCLYLAMRIRAFFEQARLTTISVDITQLAEQLASRRAT